ncbi:MAG: type II toxin-antitoxin system RelE/ParE family toxin [Candidatus Saccharimonadales bacterium]
MIKTFSHKGLKRLFERDDASGVRADQVERIGSVLAHLDEAKHPSDLALPGYRLHPLRGDLKGYWSVTVSGNWRIVFRFEKSDALDVDLVDYH